MWSSKPPISLTTRHSTSTIHSEDEFNDFLLTSPHTRTAPNRVRWLRSMLRTDHRIVFTHGDFHPRNIMVVDMHDPHAAVGATSDTDIEVSGIIDWDTSGFYPEYWEELKALNTRSPCDPSDWWEHLLPCILGHEKDIVLDRLIETSVLR
jgi:hypothetical protein